MVDPAKWLTQARFDEYLVAANHDGEAARQLYEWNTAVSAAFFELISHVEVSLRNALDAVLTELEVAETARVRHREGWWFASATFLQERDLAFYQTAQRHLGPSADSVGRDKVLSSMTFGVWEVLFGKSYESLFRQHLVYAFPDRSHDFKRSTVQPNITALKNLRNRIAHHQAIFDHPLEERFEQAMDLLGWIDADLKAWVLGLSRVPALLDQRPAVAESMAVVVPANEAWPLYKDIGAYVCQPGRYFRQVSHIAFYADAAIQIEVPKVLERIDHVAWSSDEIGRLMATGAARDKRIAEIIRESRQRGWVDDEYQLYLLTDPDRDGRARGHVTLSAPIPQPRRGRGSAWVRRQRYAATSALEEAKTVSDLDQH